MRTAFAVFLLLAALSSGARTEDNYVVDLSQPLPEGQSYEVTDGVVKVVDIDETIDADQPPLLVLRLQGKNGIGEVSLWQFHKDEAGFVQPLGKPGTGYNSDKTAGVIQLTNLAVGRPEVKTPEWEQMLSMGKRFVIENIELIIYAPDYASFKAELVGEEMQPATDGSGRLVRKVKMDKSLGWIEGSL